MLVQARAIEPHPQMIASADATTDRRSLDMRNLLGKFQRQSPRTASAYRLAGVRCSTRSPGVDRKGDFRWAAPGRLRSTGIPTGRAAGWSPRVWRASTPAGD